MAVARVGSNPVWGHLSDAALGRTRALSIGAFGAAASAAALYWADGLRWIVATAFVFAVFNTVIQPNADVLALVYLGEERMQDYGRIRQYESVSYGASCLLVGLTLDQAGVEWAMPICAAASFAVFAWSATLEPDPPAHTEHGGRLGTVGAVFQAAPRFWGFLLAQLLIWAGFNAAWNFVALKIVRAGGTPLLVGIGTALGGLVEVFAIRWAARLGRSVGLRLVFVLGALTYALGFLLWGLIRNPTAVSVLATLEGLGFGLLYTTGVVVVGRMVPASLSATGQSLAITAGFGLGPILGAGLGGLVYDRFGATTLYLGASMLTLCGAAVSWLVLSPPALSLPERLQRRDGEAGLEPTA
jgi:MFS family permease